MMFEKFFKLFNVFDKFFHNFYTLIKFLGVVLSF